MRGGSRIRIQSPQPCLLQTLSLDVPWPEQPDKEDQNLLGAWPWLLPPRCTGSIGRQALLEGLVLGLLTSIKSLCLFTCKENELTSAFL